MPYKVEKKGQKWAVVSKEDGDVKGTHDSKESAMKQMRLLYMVDSESSEDPRTKAMRKHMKSK